MKVYIPNSIILDSTEFSKFKTPAIRTKGFSEQSGQTRGNGDLLDTVGCFMLLHHLASSHIPSTYHLTLLQGDETDLTVKSKNKNVTINVKTSSWQPKDDNPESYCHLAVKESEFNKVSDIYSQIMVHLNPINDKPHIHFCGWIWSNSLNFEDVTTIPNTGGSKGLWIPSSSLNKFEDLVLSLK